MSAQFIVSIYISIMLLSVVYLFLQAFFYDVKIGITVLIYFLSVTGFTAFYESLAGYAYIFSIFLHLLFFGVFLFKYYRQKFVYMPLSVMLISTGCFSIYMMLVTA
jgi:hypothetical protein